MECTSCCFVATSADAYFDHLLFACHEPSDSSDEYTLSFKLPPRPAKHTIYRRRSASCCSQDLLQASGTCGAPPPKCCCSGGRRASLSAHERLHYHSHPCTE
ncbi:hypothetical protein GQ54DRAFT_128233 [Martensiomyces pterosporus]|nr:hypothetical protein GQ54DRAFT_128233 [Martensiomyces pterosporus]